MLAAAEAEQLGYGGVSLVSRACGLSRASISKGINELAVPALPEDRIRRSGGGRRKLAERDPKLPSLLESLVEPLARGEPESPLRWTCKSTRTRAQQYRIRRPGGGRKLTEAKDPTVVTALERMLTDEVAGDPMTDQKWIRSSLSRLSKRLGDEGHQASTGTVARLLRKMGFSLKANKRKQGRLGCSERDEQFKYIASQKDRFITTGLPVISIDTKKTELFGEFMNKGRTWRRQAEEVNEHDFPGAAKCRAVPFGIYDVARNEGHVYVGVSNNTPAFAAHSIARWWQDDGHRIYPNASSVLILADSGGSNGCRARAWKLSLQQKLCNEFGLTVTVCHYPTGCSKWNPVEHRLFSFISRNWEGKPLKTLEIMLGYIWGTTTVTGLSVKAFLDEAYYGRGQKITRDDIARLNLESHAVCPKWNYTMYPAAKEGGDS